MSIIEDLSHMARETFVLIIQVSIMQRLFQDQSSFSYLNHLSIVQTSIEINSFFFRAFQLFSIALGCDCLYINRNCCLTTIKCAFKPFAYPEHAIAVPCHDC